MKAFILVGLLAVSVGARAAETKCTSGKSERKIEVTYAGEGGKPPCEVKYTKEDGEAKTLWNAQNDGAYCEEKAKGLAEKLSGSGWTCEGDLAGGGAPAEAAPEKAEGDEKAQ